MGVRSHLMGEGSLCGEVRKRGDDETGQCYPVIFSSGPK